MSLDDFRQLKKKRAEEDQNIINKIIEMNNKIQQKAQKYGVYSLSCDPLNELMWAHYTYNHRGFVIEFDQEKLIQECEKMYATHMPVSYSPIVPELNYTDLTDNFKRMYATKSEAWEYEKEFRFVFKESGLKSIAPESITGIYFGANMRDDHKKRIINDLQHLTHIKYYQIATQDNSYEFIKNELTRDDIEAIKSYSNAENYTEDVR